MPVRVKMALFSFIFPSFSTFVAVFFEMSFFIFTFSFLDKWLIISLLEKRLSCLLFQFQSAFLSQAVGLFSAAFHERLSDEEGF